MEGGAYCLGGGGGNFLFLQFWRNKVSQHIKVYESQLYGFTKEQKSIQVWTEAVHYLPHYKRELWVFVEILLLLHSVTQATTAQSVQLLVYGLEGWEIGFRLPAGARYFYGV
jgi:hypothetical protein